MACYDIVVDYEWMIDLMVICNLVMNCYDIVVDSQWIVDLIDDL